MSIGEKLLDALNELNALGLLEEFKAENRELVDSFMNKLYVAELATLRAKLAEAEKERDEALISALDVERNHSGLQIAQELLGAAEPRWSAIHLEIKDIHAKLATANADCAAMREALEFYGSQKFFAVMPDDGKTRVVPICNEDGSFAHYLAFVNDDGEIARAALTRPTGQSILDELSAARKVCEIAQWQENGGMWPENYADALDAYRAAHKANTGDKQ